MGSYIWLVLMVIFLIVEATTVTMISLWFAAGSLAALLASLLGAGLGLQIGVALAVSALTLAALRPVVRKHFTPKLTKTNVDAVIGSRGYVTADIDNVSAQGTVKLGAMEWTARSVTGETIPRGTLVEVDRIEGVKVFVRAVKETVEV